MIHPDVFFRCVEDSGEAIMVTDTAGLLIYVNPAWCRIYEYSREEAIGKKPSLLHSGLQDSSFYKKMWRDIEDPFIGHFRGELTNRAKSGRLIPVLLTITQYRDLQGAVSGYMGIAVDMSTQKQLENQVRRQDRLASIGLLASGLAHEIGTPLGVIRGRAELLQMKVGESPFLHEGLKIIVQQIDRISKLIQSLLRLSRSPDGAGLVPILLKPSIQEVASLVYQNFKTQNVSLNVDIPEQLEVLADQNRLQQVMLNLFMNALHAIQSEMKRGRTDSFHVKVSAHLDGARVLLRVQDTGCGIPADHLKKIFEPFFTTKEVGEGTGLGLSIVSKIMFELNGDIQVESQVGVGTTFTLILQKSESNA